MVKFRTALEITITGLSKIRVRPRAQKDPAKCGEGKWTVKMAIGGPGSELE
jgi:hypothetical protein